MCVCVWDRATALFDELRLHEELALQSRSDFGSKITLHFLSNNIVKTATKVGKYEDHFAYFKVVSVHSMAKNA